MAPPASRPLTDFLTDWRKHGEDVMDAFLAARKVDVPASATRDEKVKLIAESEEEKKEQFDIRVSWAKKGIDGYKADLAKYDALMQRAEREAELVKSQRRDMDHPTKSEIAAYKKALTKMKKLKKPEAYSPSFLWDSLNDGDSQESEGIKYKHMVSPAANRKYDEFIRDKTLWGQLMSDVYSQYIREHREDMSSALDAIHALHRAAQPEVSPVSGGRKTTVGVSKITPVPTKVTPAPAKVTPVPAKAAPVPVLCDIPENGRSEVAVSGTKVPVNKSPTAKLSVIVNGLEYSPAQTGLFSSANVYFYNHPNVHDGKAFWKKATTIRPGTSKDFGRQGEKFMIGNEEYFWILSGVFARQASSNDRKEFRGHDGELWLEETIVVKLNRNGAQKLQHNPHYHPYDSRKSTSTDNTGGSSRRGAAPGRKNGHTTNGNSGSIGPIRTGPRG